MILEYDKRQNVHQWFCSNVFNQAERLEPPVRMSPELVRTLLDHSDTKRLLVPHGFNNAGSRVGYLFARLIVLDTTLKPYEMAVDSPRR